MVQSSTRNMGESRHCWHFTLNTTEFLLTSYIVNCELKTVKIGEDTLMIAKVYTHIIYTLSNNNLKRKLKNNTQTPNHTTNCPFNLITIILFGNTQSLFIHHCKYLVVSQSLNQLELHELIPYLQRRY